MDRLRGEAPLRNAIQSPPVSLSDLVPYANLKEKTVLITGGASGIGAAFASHLAQHGANVIIGDVNESQGTDLVAWLRASSSSADHHFLKLDVTDWDSQVAFFKSASELSPHKGIDCVIANAGINDSTESNVLELDVPRYSALEKPPPPKLKTLRVDLDGVLYTATLALSYLSENPGSSGCSLETENSSRDRHLLLISSIAGLIPMPASSIYVAAKHGVTGLFRSLRITAPIVHGVRVNMICPQYVETSILGARGTSTLLGVPKTQVDDVAEAATRLVADQRIIGRALLVGTRGSDGQVEAAGLDAVPNRHADGSIWDIYGHDFAQTDLLMRRVVTILNLVTDTRGWVGFIRDIFAWIAASIRGLVDNGSRRIRHL